MMDTSTVYVGLILSLCLLGYGLFSRIHGGGADGPVCPCSDPKYCERIKDTTRKEVRTRGGGGGVSDTALVARKPVFGIWYPESSLTF